MSDKKSFVLYRTWTDFILALPDEQSVQITKAIFAYEAGEEYEITDTAMAAYFLKVVKPELEENAAKYQAKVDNANATNGKRNGNLKSVTQNEKSVTQNSESVTQNVDSVTQNSESVSVTVTDTDTDTVTDNNNPPYSPPEGRAGNDVQLSAVQERRFDEFWRAYPKKVGKGNARRSWKRIAPDEVLFEHIIDAVNNNTSNNDQWHRDNGQYIPNPSTWLNQQRWDDEITGGAYSQSNDGPYGTEQTAQEVKPKTEQEMLAELGWGDMPFT